jgi:hypothetical protein
MTAKGRPLTVEDVRAWHATEEALGGRGTWTDATRVCVRLLLTEIDRLRSLLESGAEQVHVMGRELRALRRQLEDARRDAGAFLRELEQL